MRPLILLLTLQWLGNEAVPSFDPSRLVIQHIYRGNDSGAAVWTNSRLQNLLWNQKPAERGGGVPRVDRGTTVFRRTHRHTDSDFSRNISLVLENLLKNYERSELPNHGRGEPTVVKTNILIRSMGPVSELDMDYSMDCYFRQSWRDSRLSYVGPIKNLSLSIKMLERIWRPDTYFYNGKHSYVHTITVPNKLLRITQHGDILYSMRLTIKAKCPMQLQSFPMDRQSCPLILGSYAYPSHQLQYQWQSAVAVTFSPGMTLSQFDLMGSPQRNFTFKRREGEFSLLQVNFNLQRNTGYFLIQVYVPCILIVVLSWVSFWIHREATSDRVGLCITTVLTLSTISLDSRTDLPKVRYATALDWFLLMSFLYCIATLLEFAGVHYFTKVGSGEIPVDEEEWEDVGVDEKCLIKLDNNMDCFFVVCKELKSDEQITSSSDKYKVWEFLVDDCSGSLLQKPETIKNFMLQGVSSVHIFLLQVVGLGVSMGLTRAGSDTDSLTFRAARRRSSLICPIYNDPTMSMREGISASPKRLSLSTLGARVHASRTTVERQTQTENRVPLWKQLFYCLVGDENYRKQRQREATRDVPKHVNSVSYIDQAARVLFPATFFVLNFAYWMFYGASSEDFKWKDPPSVAH